MAASAVCIPLPFTQSGGEEIKAAEVSVPTLTVQMDEGTRALKHGAAGWLYGLADEEVPASSLINVVNLSRHYPYVLQIYPYVKPIRCSVMSGYPFEVPVRAND